ncbi:MAG: site-specific integrase [Bacteroidetes bacterium]|nr:site-specific integrase [Bacteroidota bacterium]
MASYKPSFVFKNKADESLVLFRANSKFIRGGRFQISTGQRAKTKGFKPTTEMKKVEAAFADAFDNHHTGNELREPARLKELVTNILFPDLAEARPQKREMTVAEFIADFIERESDTVSEGTVKNWKSLYNNLMWYDKHIRFSEVSETWIKDFKRWLRGEHKITGTRGYNKGKKLVSSGINEQTAWKYVRNLRKMLKAADDDDEHDYKVNPGYKKYKRSKKDQDESKGSKYSGVYLSIEEQKSLKNLVLSENKALVRDWILIACSTGQRYSDWNKLRPENVTTTPQGDIIELTQQKTNAEVAIPMSETVKRIWSKYPDGMKLPSDNHIRIVIKELCKTISLDNVIESKPKYKHIGTHIGRYSFISNGIDQNIPERTLMAITGHFDKAVFSQYLHITQQKLAEKAKSYPMFSEAL